MLAQSEAGLLESLGLLRYRTAEVGGAPSPPLPAPTLRHSYPLYLSLLCPHALVDDVLHAVCNVERATDVVLVTDACVLLLPPRYQVASLREELRKDKQLVFKKQQVSARAHCTGVFFCTYGCAHENTTLARVFPLLYHGNTTRTITSLTREQGGHTLMCVCVCVCVLSVRCCNVQTHRAVDVRPHRQNTRLQHACIHAHLTASMSHRSVQVMYKPTYSNVTSKDALLVELQTMYEHGRGGMVVEQLKESYPTVAEDIQQLVDDGRALLVEPVVRGGRKAAAAALGKPIDDKAVLFYRDRSYEVDVDGGFKEQWKNCNLGGKSAVEIKKLLASAKLPLMRTEVVDEGVSLVRAR
jgi:hypothetical protein